MTRFATTAAIVLVVVAIAGMLLANQTSAVRVVQENGTVLACSRVSPGTTITLTFTHSMYGGDVSETWLVHGNGLERMEMVTDNAAAAEYYAWDGEVERTGDRFRVVTLPLHEKSLVVRVDQIGQHRLMIGPETYDLAAVIDGSAQVRIEPMTAPIWQGTPC